MVTLKQIIRTSTESEDLQASSDDSNNSNWIEKILDTLIRVFFIINDFFWLTIIRYSVRSKVVTTSQWPILLMNYTANDLYC